jgi:hypothetical protein
MKKLLLTLAALAGALTLTSPAAGAQADYMAGGGWIDDPELAPAPNIKVREGLKLYCLLGLPGNSLEVTWGSGNYFHLTGLNSVSCNGNDPSDRKDGGMISGSGEGRCNGQHAFISFVFVDDPDLRTGDRASIAIEGDDPDLCSVATNTLLPLRGGNFTFIDNADI